VTRWFVIAAVLVAACKESGKAERISGGRGASAKPGPAPTWEPEPGDGPRCDEIAARLAAPLGGPHTATVDVGGSQTNVDVDIGAGVAAGLRDTCRRDRWTRPQRDCAYAFDGDIIADMPRFRTTCLGAGR
jgi:hypothetical protein